MNNKNEKLTTEPIIITMKVPDDFRDPLDPENIFDEMEVEQWDQYYNIHLGIKTPKKEKV
jgi:hypothetical protein